MDIQQYRLILFDLDGTLAPFDSDELYPDAAAWFENNPYQRCFICTNQGGIGLRAYMEAKGFGNPEKYPTLETFTARIKKLFPDMPHGDYKMWLNMCAAYQMKNGEWCPTPEWGKGLAMFNHDWRKPAPGMLKHAMVVAGLYEPHETLMVGDSDDDRLAAEAAGCGFSWAWEFFGRAKPADDLR